MTASLVITVGSENPVKVAAVETAAKHMTEWQGIKVTGIEVPSGVSAQPMSDEETRRGARNRATAALQTNSSHSSNPTDPSPSTTHLGAGLEGGVFVNENGEMWSTVWVAVTPDGQTFFESNGMRFPLPKVVAERINQGAEMSHAMDALTGLQKTKHGLGMVGIITGGLVDRTEAYSAIAKLALGLWKGQHWQNHG